MPVRWRRWERRGPGGYLLPRCNPMENTTDTVKCVSQALRRRLGEGVRHLVALNSPMGWCSS